MQLRIFVVLWKTSKAKEKETKIVNKSWVFINRFEDFAAVSAFSSITYFFPNTSFMNTHSDIYDSFSCHSGKHGAGNMNHRLNSKRQLAHKLFRKYFSLFGSSKEFTYGVWMHSK